MSIYDPAEEQREIALLKAKLAEERSCHDCAEYRAMMGAKLAEMIELDAEATKSLNAELAAAHEEIKFHHGALVRVAEAVGVTEPLQLIALAENNNENYVDLLIKHIAAAREQMRVLREALRRAADLLDCWNWKERTKTTHPCSSQNKCPACLVAADAAIALRTPPEEPKCDGNDDCLIPNCGAAHVQPDECRGSGKLRIKIVAGSGSEAQTEETADFTPEEAASADPEVKP